MKWYKKFKVGQEVRVVEKVVIWRFDNGGGAGWNINGTMDKTVGKVYTIISIDNSIGYLLNTKEAVGSNYWYPVDALQESVKVGEQLLFDFMKGVV